MRARIQDFTTPSVDAQSAPGDCGHHVPPRVGASRLVDV